MLIVGAGGFAREMLLNLDTTEDVHFFDDVSPDDGSRIYGKFPVVRSFDEAKRLFVSDKRFLLGIGNPEIRKKLCLQFEALGGEVQTSIHPSVLIGNFDSTIAAGATIMAGSILTNSVKIEKGCLINLSCTIGHDVIIGEFSEICPNVSISGGVLIGNEVFIGTGAVILPKVQIGHGAIIGAGSVVTKDVPAHTRAVGVPARHLRK